MQIYNIEYEVTNTGENIDKTIPKDCTSLIMQNKSLKSIPPSIFTLKTLISLKINQNLLNEIPIDLFCLTNLKKLDFSYNLIFTINPEISKLSNLISLNLSHNLITSIHPEISKLKKLRFLYLNSNKLTRIHRELENLENLAILDIRDNPIKSNNKEDQLGHLSLRSIFGEKLLLKEVDLDRLRPLTRFLKQNLKNSFISIAMAMIMGIMYFIIRNITIDRKANK